MNGNSNGIGQLKRMEFEFKGHSYLFTINPEMYDITIPNRMNLVYTKAGAFIDLFGEGVNEITISGTTGWKATTGDRNHGYEKFIELKDLFQTNMNNIVDGMPVTLDDLLKFYNHTDGLGYYTVPSKLRIYRNVAQPLLYKYDIALLVIKALNEARGNSETLQIGSNIVPATMDETVLDRDIIEKADTSKFSTANKSVKSIVNTMINTAQLAINVSPSRIASAIVVGSSCARYIRTSSCSRTVSPW